MVAVTHPRLAPRRGAVGGTWWSKAMLRTVEEAAFSTAELRRGRALARSGAVGAITVSEGSYVAAVLEREDAFTVTGTVPPLDARDQALLVELIGAEAGRIGALMSGDLPHAFVEALEETGVELLPHPGELGTACTCEGWLDPCPHALAVLTQVAWLAQRDPFVLLLLRGLGRDEVLARLHELAGGSADGPVDDLAGMAGMAGMADDLALAEEAAMRAARELGQLGQR